jgi:transcription elongation GreA/GreB family factor
MSRAFTKERDDAPERPLAAPKREEPEYRRPADPSEVGFGATVRVAGAQSFDRTFTILKDAEADVASGRIGMSSPLAQALLGAHAGERVVWHRPAGDLELEVVELSYR